MIYDDLVKKKVFDGNLEEISDIVSFYTKKWRSYSDQLSPTFTHYIMFFMFIEFYLISFLLMPWKPISNFIKYIFTGVEKTTYIRFITEMLFTRKKFGQNLNKNDL